MSSLEKKNNIYERKRLLDKVVKYFFLFLALLCASFVIFIAVFITYKGIYPFFHNYSLIEGNYIHQDIDQFFTNSRWLYDGMGGMPFLLLTTLYTTLLSLVISVPTSIFTALLLVRIVPKFLKSMLQSAVDLLASIPSVIYGLFGAGVICPIVASLGIETFGGRSILSGVIVLAMMSIPTMTTLSMNAMEAVDKKLIQSSIALGASKAQTNFKIVIGTATSGIFAGIILGIGRALGEATAIQMVIGNNSLGTSFYNVFAPGNTLTSAMLAGIGEAAGIGYDVRFSLGLVLIIVILIISSLLSAIKQRMNPNYKKEDSLFYKMKSLFRKKEGTPNGK
ncbi:MAG: phosphate ABC transporter permease subunit PstC [Mollicutes bacterium]|nr:phosphate ABC transporter permease subunit PstC [Mollicutes bacterium]MDY6069873.1 phosphate ABC transporter permease subunit PstC [Bacilli bacterium]